MKILLAWVLALSGVGIARANDTSEYVLIIDGVTNTVELGASQTVDFSGGSASVKLEKKAATRFVRPMFNFSLADSVGVNSASIGEAVHQSLITTPRGALILIQEYETTNPEAMVDIMLEEITKNERAGDYDVNTEKIAKTVGEIEIKGLRAHSSQAHEEWVREVYSVSAGESGVLIVTAIEMKNNAQELALISEFWETLSLTLTTPPSSVDL